MWIGLGDICSSCTFPCILPGCCSQDGCVRTVHYLGKAGSQTREIFQSPNNATDRPKPQNCSKFFTFSFSNHVKGCNRMSDESIVGTHHVPTHNLCTMPQPKSHMYHKRLKNLCFPSENQQPLHPYTPLTSLPSYNEFNIQYPIPCPRTRSLSHAT